MTDLATPPAATAEDHGLVGDRELVCVQTIDIGRLRSAPVPITPGTFIAVSGRGPKGDSNGSGKTTFLAAVALLHGEVGWHLANGAPEAASLLFDGTKAGVDVQRYARADHGYVIGVFRSRGSKDAMTVWLRINAAAPVLKARAIEGFNLVEATTSTARAAAADAVWASLPKPEWGSRGYAHALYGSTPRCMAWLQARGNEMPGRSLLKLSQEMLEPEQIGTALLELLGRDDLLDEDRAARAELDATSREVEQLRNDEVAQRRQEDDELAAIANRNQARLLLTRAERLWTLHYAKGLVDSVSRADDARAAIRPAGDDRRAARRQLHATIAAIDEIGDGAALKAAVAAAQIALDTATEELVGAGKAKSAAQTRLSDLLARIDELAIAAEAWDGSPLSDLEAHAITAAEDLAAATAAHAVATADRQRRESELQAAEAGTAGAAAEASERLAAAGIAATPLLDGVEVDPTARAAWEPRLTPYRDAVVIATQVRDDALAAAAAGDMLIDGDPSAVEPPPGIVAAPRAAVPFLHWLAAAVPSDQRTARHGEHVTVVGGFADPITGRQARIIGARRAVDEAQEVERGTAELAAKRKAAAEDASRLVAAAHAAAARDEARGSERALRAAIANLDEAENVTAEAHRRAVAEQGRAAEAWGGHDQHRKRLGDARQRDEQAVFAATQALRISAERWSAQRQRVPYWSVRWGGDLGSAAAALAGDAAEHPTGDDRSSSGAYRRAANHAIDRALTVCGIDSDTGAGAPAGSGVDLAVAERTAAGGARDDDDGQSYERQASAFHHVADALGAWLRRLQLEDEATASHIANDRDRRATALAAAQDLCDERSRNLPMLQDQIERLLRTSLSAVADKLNQLDLAAQGAGADLLIEPQRPATSNESWVWRVTPRYRRGPNGALVPYIERANTATEKLLAIHLVLAALFAATAARGTDAGRVLILDELGDSLGDYHREAVLHALARTAAEAGITVLGTCQDGVLEDAARHCGLLLYFQFRDPSDILNAPTRVFGTTHDGSVIEQTAPFIERLG